MARAIYDQVDRVLRILEKGTLVLSIVAVAGICLLTTADVAGRYLFGKPINGSFEIVELTQVGLVFFALPFVQYVGAHIGMDFVLEHLGRKASRIITFVDLLIILGICVVLFWYTLQNALYAYSIKMVTTSFVTISVWPSKFFIPVALLIVICRVILTLSKILADQKSSVRSTSLDTT